MSCLYDYPQLYDVLFSDTCTTEIRFIESVLQKFCPQHRRTAMSVFEPACGTGRLLWRLAKRGYNVAGLDLNTKSVAYCNRRMLRHALTARSFCGDMTNFTLADLQRKQPFDAAYNLVSSFLHLTNDTQARQHLAAVAGVLKPDGIYILGLHLKPAGQAFCGSESWSMRHGTLSLHSKLRTLSCNSRKHVETVEFRIDVRTPKKRYSVIDRFPLRTYTAKQFYRLLKSANCFRIIETYTFDYDIEHPIKVNDTTEDTLFILRR
ncbi:MAG: class I SAM-dependent methyltransferase [Planctomycetaceae bacterium]|jgi:SAM-dependent methyltransferase|nr:class I SAM-dependent methyltransferase [Planctomycetaceae bacterium]